MDDLWKLESTDTAQSRRVATRLQARLKASRDPALLGDIVEFYFKTFSKRARKVLTSLREAHSQDFFDKLNDSIEKTSTRLPVLKLLAHLLKSSQTNWLYRIVDHPLFSSILKHLKTSGDVVVLSNALFVVSAILPMVPSYIGHHLQELFTIFCELTTIKETNRLDLTPKELYLHLDVAVYYFFLQLYALFPCNLFQFLKTHYSHSTAGELNAFQEYIAPLFAQVQLHPSLVTDSFGYELSKAKWGSMEPHDIATLSLQLCLDTSVEERASHTALQPPANTSFKSNNLALTPTAFPIHQDLSSTNAVSESSTPQAAPKRTHSITHPDNRTSQAATNAASFSCNLSSQEVPECVQVLSDLPDAAGLKSTQELNQFWSPSVTLGHIAPSCNDSISHSSGYTSLNPPSRPSLQPSNISTPISDSTMSSAQHTPGPVSANAFNYSPTASVDGESIRSMTQSAIHSATFFEDSHLNTTMDPLSQSMRIVRTGDSSSHVSPTRSLPGGHGTKEQSFKKKFNRFIGMFTQKGRTNLSEENMIQEDFTEIFISDLEREGRRSQQKMAVLGRREEVGEECFAASPVNVQLQVPDTPPTHQPSAAAEAAEEEIVKEKMKCKRDSQDEEIIKISNLPISTRTTRTNSESSHDSRAEIDASSDHLQPRPPLLVGSYQHDGPTETISSTYSASYPERSPTMKRSRHRNSKSETNATHTMMMVQERLQRLVEASESSNHSFVSSSGSNAHTNSTVEEMNLGVSVEEDPLLGERPKLGTFASVESTKTLKIPSPAEERDAVLPSASSGAVQLSQSVSSVVSKTPSESVLSGSRMFIRRVSVCSARQPEPQQQQSPESHSENVYHASPNTNPSPVLLLDQFVIRGEILHKGNFESIPLTELEGVDWNHFGGCPHSEEFGMMRSQVALLHSQLLFERHQCLQHARRNRRLLSRARMATQVTEQLVSLRGQLQQQNLLIASQTQQLRSTDRSGFTKAEDKLRTENKTFAVENNRLKDSNTRLTEEVRRLKEQNAQLTEELKHTNEKMFSLENEMLHVQPRLKRGEQLQAEVDSLTRELQVLGELYHQQRDEMQEAASQRKREQEWRAMCTALQREKESLEKKTKMLHQELSVNHARVTELHKDIEKKNSELQSLRDKLQKVQGQYEAKMKALGKKYFSTKLIGQHLETHIMELRGQQSLSNKKSHDSISHRRWSSQPTGSRSSTGSPSSHMSPPSHLTH